MKQNVLRILRRLLLLYNNIKNVYPSFCTNKGLLKFNLQHITNLSFWLTFIAQTSCMMHPINHQSEENGHQIKSNFRCTGEYFHFHTIQKYLKEWMYQTLWCSDQNFCETLQWLSCNCTYERFMQSIRYTRVYQKARSCAKERN